MPLTYLITGCNRGIGLEYLRYLSQETTNIIIGTVRDKSKINGELAELLKEHKNIFIVTLDLSSQSSIDQVVSQIEEVTPDGIDIFINNAALSKTPVSLIDDTWENHIDHYKANALGPVKLFKAIKPFLNKKDTKKVIFTSTGLAGIQNFYDHSATVYSMSKAALNFAVRSLDHDLRGEGFIIVATEPGICDTDLFNEGFDTVKGSLPEEYVKAVRAALKPPKTAAVGILEHVVNKITIEDGGKWLSWDQGKENVY